MTPTRFVIEVKPKIPDALSRLEEIAHNLIYSWNRQVRGLFFRLDKALWDATGHNPKVFLRRVDQRKLEAAADDPVFMLEYMRVVSTYDSYLHGQINKKVTRYLDQEKDLVSYFCAEFGLHESVPLYSGGLGILAGDHCKACSDLGLPFIAVGILYRQGYFTQEIDQHGNQLARYSQTHFSDLPIRPVIDSQGKKMEVTIPLPGRILHVRVWRADIGHIALLLLDTDLESNQESDRRITYQLYGGDKTNRLLQEMVLGIGGVKAERALGLKPTVWHINEGHAAFMILERCRECIQQDGLSFEAALEAVAACTVFTTHTPVPAGHDVFDHPLIEYCFSEYLKEFNVSAETVLALGNSPMGERVFNMTALALRGSRFHNGVSRIHGRVASEMESYIWPQVPPSENPIRYVTNGVHVPTFLASEWANLFDLQYGGEWRTELLNKEYWNRIEEMPTHTYWSIRQSLKAKMLDSVYRRCVQQYRRNGVSESQIRRLTRFVRNTKTDILTLGFARRFATYKRATLLFSDPARLSRLMNDSKRPVVMIFAGKAHPHDFPGQDLIRRIHQLAHSPEFEGRIILLENYDVALARKLVAGVDVWVNTPAYPLEASGTSGQKAGINGVLNLSVLDGWWDEGYNGNNGWAITPHDEKFSVDFRDQEESRELVEVLENEIIPIYYQRDNLGYSPQWIEKSKNAMQSLMPQFNAQRMVMDYITGFYAPASKHGRRLTEQHFAHAQSLAAWKAKVRSCWPGVNVELIQRPNEQIFRDETFGIKVAVSLNGLDPQDITIDCLLGRELTGGDFERHACFTFVFLNHLNDGRALFGLDTNVAEPGLLHYSLRMYPYSPLLGQRFEVGCMLWL